LSRRPREPFHRLREVLVGALELIGVQRQALLRPLALGDVPAETLEK
jgi:hypothetical protein